jgi:hypothetical protein
MEHPPKYSRCADADEDVPLRSSSGQLERETCCEYMKALSQERRNPWYFFIGLQAVIFGLSLLTTWCILHSQLLPQISTCEVSCRNTLSTVSTHVSHRCNKLTSTLTLAHEADTLRLQAEDNSYKASIYTGNPSPENDAAWSNRAPEYPIAR